MKPCWNHRRSFCVIFLFLFFCHFLTTEVALGINRPLVDMITNKRLYYCSALIANTVRIGINAEVAARHCGRHISMAEVAPAV